MLHPGIGRGFSAGLERLSKVEGVETLVGGPGEAADSDGSRPVAASLLRTTVPTLLDDPEAVLEECFGPVSVIVEYADTDELTAAADAMVGSLTATVHAEDSDQELVGQLLPVLTERAGRVVWNGWPTGVAVSWAMHHGGPFPSTVGSVHTSVGTTAARRFQRPVCFQDAPQALLPELLHDRNTAGVERRVDGEITRDDVRSGR
jgi:NADP-dependent aldehyde dehydrogenase